MILETCHTCGRRAVWMYMPGGYDYCDDCVPRGCSCNEDADGAEAKDDKGRLYPCCEFSFYEEGFEREIDISLDEEFERMREAKAYAAGKKARLT